MPYVIIPVLKAQRNFSLGFKARLQEWAVNIGNPVFFFSFNCCKAHPTIDRSSAFVHF